MTTQPAAPARSEYEHTGQGRDRRQRTRRAPSTRLRLWRLEVTVGAGVLMAITVVLTTWPPAVPPRPTPPGVTREHSGLVIADGFSAPIPTRDLLDRYAFNGSAHRGVGWQAATAHGLDIGVRDHHGWQGWFAVTLHAAGADVAWHAVMRQTPHGPTGEQEAVFAVQSASTQHNGTINYVVVAALSTGGHRFWQVGFAHGVYADAVTDVLWREEEPPTTPLAAPVTVQTDGHRTLMVWIGDRLVYASGRLHMDNPAPFQAYLEVQARDSAFVSNFTDFWVAKVAPVAVVGLAPGTHVTLRTAGAGVTAVAGADGRAALRLPTPHLVGTGTLTLRTESHVRTVTGVPFAGGDVLRVGSS